MSSTLQQLDVDLFHQDALDNLLFKDIDVVVSDLPVGYSRLTNAPSNLRPRRPRDILMRIIC